MTKNEKLLQRVSHALAVYLEVATVTDTPLLKEKVLLEARGFLPGLLEEIHRKIVNEACNDHKPLTREQVLLALKGVQNNQDFIVIFRTTKDDIREMHCRIDRERKNPFEDPKETFTVWDTEKIAPRSFRLDSVYSLKVTNLPE